MPNNSEIPWESNIRWTPGYWNRALISDAKIKARQILLDAKDEANEIIRNLNTLTKSSNLSEANIYRNKLNESINNLSDFAGDQSITQNKALSANDVFVGMEVFSSKFNSNGVVLSLPNASNEVKIQIGSLTINSKLNELSPCKKSNSSSKKAHNNSSVSFSNSKSQVVSSEINVIGLNVDEAIPIVDKYLDDCYMANLKTARIIHGKGTGRLRERNS